MPRGRTTKDKPVDVRKYRGDDGHCLETRIFARRIHETYCVEPGCKFKGKHAAQGVCFSKLKSADNAYLERIEKRAVEFLKETREIRKRSKMSPGAYIKWLESHILCDWMNQEFTMDELIRMRGKTALLKLGAGRG